MDAPYYKYCRIVQGHKNYQFCHLILLKLVSKSYNCQKSLRLDKQRARSNFIRRIFRQILNTSLQAL